MNNKNYISKIFNKESSEITINDLEDFFSTPQEETSVLEFKSGQVEIIDLYKEITAFLNTEGGLIIVGSPREEKKRIKKNEITICQGELTYSNFKNKDWIYQKITSNITPTPVDLKITEFINPNGGIFLIDVPQSQNPPHQSSADGKYYIRLEREAKPAPHGIVQALFNKRRLPNINAKFEIKEINENWDTVSVRIQNESPIPADKVSFIIDVFNVEKVESKFTFIPMEDALGKKFSMSNSAKNVLVQIISVSIEFQVQHFGQEYLIMVGYWCKDLDFDFKFISYSPNDRKFISEGYLNKGDLLTKELERINGKTLPNNV